jgi:pimeloyl-ACP methyl ester carboxylesterase
MAISPQSRFFRAGIRRCWTTMFATAPSPIRPTSSGAARRLKFRPEIEAEIYSTVPHRLVPYMRLHPPGAPVAFIAGTRSREVRQAGLGATQRLTQGRISWIEGSHLFPFEQPGKTVDAVLGWIARLDRDIAA